MRKLLVMLISTSAFAGPPDVKEAIGQVEAKFVADTRVQAQETREAPMPQIPEKPLNLDGIKQGMEIRREGQSIVITGEKK